MIRTKTLGAGAALLLLFSGIASAQMPGGGPPAVGVTTVKTRSIIEKREINGRVQSVGEVELVSRISAFLEEQLFEDGAEVKKGDLLFRLERAPFEAEVEAKRAALAQAEAQLENARTAFARAEQLRSNGSGTQSLLDDARAQQRTAEAQVRAAKAALSAAEINLGYTEIRSPIDGRVGRAAVTVGNVVSPSSGPLATVVSQDPMYVSFPLSMRQVLELKEKHAESGLQQALAIKVRLPDGKMYEHAGSLDFFDIRVAQDTDSLMVRGKIPNPVAKDGSRELVHDELVRIVLETNEPRTALAIPRAAVLKDQQGDFVYVVNGDNLAEVRRIVLGQSTPDTAAVEQGLNAGERVIVDGIQRVRSGAPVDAQDVADQSVAVRGE
jgi:RND family efflux transporter, MFP subunit